MKRIVVALCLLVVVGGFVWAETSPFYPIRLDVVKIYSHSDGYRVLYRSGVSGIADLYIPARWFVPGGKAQLVRADDPSYPSLTLFYKEGKFHHLRLYAKPNNADDTWGVMSPADGVGKFEGEDLSVAF